LGFDNFLGVATGVLIIFMARRGGDENVAEIRIGTATELEVTVTVPPSARKRARTWNFSAPLIPEAAALTPLATSVFPIQW